MTARAYEKATPAEIANRVRSGGEVLLWDHAGDHSKVLRVDLGKGARLGVDSANATIWFAGGGREVPFRVGSAAPVKVVRAEQAAASSGETR